MGDEKGFLKHLLMTTGLLTNCKTVWWLQYATTRILIPKGKHISSFWSTTSKTLRIGMIMEHILFFGNFVVHHWYRWLSLIMYMMLGISLGHDLRVGGQLRSAHTHPPCGWEPRCEGMSPSLGWLTHTSDHLWRLDSEWRWDVVFFNTQGVCKYLRYFLEQEEKLHQSIFLVASVGLR